MLVRVRVAQASVAEDGAVEILPDVGLPARFVFRYKGPDWGLLLVWMDSPHGDGSSAHGQRTPAEYCRIVSAPSSDGQRLVGLWFRRVSRALTAICTLASPDGKSKARADWLGCRWDIDAAACGLPANRLDLGRYRRKLLDSGQLAYSRQGMILNPRVAFLEGEWCTSAEEIQVACARLCDASRPAAQPAAGPAGPACLTVPERD